MSHSPRCVGPCRVSTADKAHRMDLAKTNQTSAIGVENPSCGDGYGVSGDGGRRLSHAMGRKNIETAGSTPTCGCQQHASGADNRTSTPRQQRETRLLPSLPPPPPTPPMKLHHHHDNALLPRPVNGNAFVAANGAQAGPTEKN